jgi:hypothetical protein
LSSPKRIRTSVAGSKTIMIEHNTTG